MEIVSLMNVLTISDVAFLALSLILVAAESSVFLPSAMVDVMFALRLSSAFLGSLTAWAASPSIFEPCLESESLALSRLSVISRPSMELKLKSGLGGGKPIPCWMCAPIREVLRVKISMFGSVLMSLPARRQHIPSANAMMLKIRTKSGTKLRQALNIAKIMVVVVVGELSVQQTLHDMIWGIINSSSEGQLENGGVERLNEWANQR